jgi:hypothetical protein
MPADRIIHGPFVVHPGCRRLLASEHKDHSRPEVRQRTDDAGRRVFNVASASLPCGAVNQGAQMYIGGGFLLLLIILLIFVF